MPGSAMSFATHSSAGSTGSRRAKTRSYRVVSYKSNVDESLFGTKTNPQQQNNSNAADMDLEMMARERSTKRKGSRGKKNNKETVQVITKDLIRNLIVPGEDPSGASMIMNFGEYLRIKDSSRVITKEDRQAMEERMKREKEERLEFSTMKNNELQQYELNRVRNQPLNDLEEEAKEKADYLLENANLKRQEQEDEIKHLNELILNAKCHAIRDAQVLEKVVISGEMKDEERRLDTMMEVERQNAVAMQEEIEKRRKEERLIGSMLVMQQIQEKEQEKEFDLEMKDQENIQMQKYIQKLTEEDTEKKIKKKMEQEYLKEQLNKANQEILVRKELKKDQERMIEQKVVEFQRQKAEREAAVEREQERVRIEKEKEVARLRSLQERAKDEQAERDALRAKRAQERTEREWRKKEAAEAIKKQETEAMLKVARAKQMSQKEHYLSVQANRERKEFERVLLAQKELVEKEKRGEDELHKRQMKHATDVRSQIREKEQVRIGQRAAFFEEGIKLDEEARLRRQKLDEVKRKKLNELKDAGIPDKYLSQVERKVNQPQHTFCT